MSPQISWLRLEQYHLGDLSPEQRREVEAALRDAPELQARLRAIETDDRPLPALPGGEGAAALPPDSGQDLPEPALAPVIPMRRGRLFFGLAGALAAAALALLLVAPPEPGTAAPPAATSRWKGGELSILVDRERAGQVELGVDGFQDGDRFRLRLTCAPGGRPVQAVVFQGAERARVAEAELACGNQVLVPGGFRLTGDQPATLCLGVDEGSRQVGKSRSPQELAGEDAVVCQVLLPVP